MRTLHGILMLVSVLAILLINTLLKADQLPWNGIIVVFIAALILGIGVGSDYLGKPRHKHHRAHLYRHRHE